jgi:hypothetical protein
VRPSSRARLRPALTLSITKFHSCSATAEIITTTALPKGPPVSRFSREDTNSIPRWFSVSSTSRKCRTLRAKRSVGRPNQHCVELPAVGCSEHLIESRTLRLCAADSVGVFVTISKARCSANRRKSSAWVSGFWSLVETRVYERLASRIRSSVQG